MENPMVYKVISKLSTKSITLKFDPSLLFNMKNFSDRYHTETLKKFIDLEKKEIIYTDIPVQDSSIHNILLYFTLLYTDFNLNDSINLKNSSENFTENINDEESLKLFENMEYKDYILFRDSLIMLGLKEDSSQEMLHRIRNSVFDHSKNKIWILFSPSKIFWTKSDKDCINLNKHDLKLNNYSFIYFNHSFCEKLIGRFVHHPRVRIGFMSSMNKVNVEKCSKGLLKTDKLKAVKIFSFDQTFHKELSKIEYVRNFDSIMDKHGISETQLVCIESEMDKNKNTTIKGVDYENLAIKFKVFDENYHTYSSEKQKEIEKEVDNLADFLEKLIENCVGDVREFIQKNYN
jgi:hypothetical protein